MSDIQRGLPVRTEDDPDQKIQSKIVDKTTPAQGMVVDSDGNAHVEAHGNDPGGTDKVIRLSELGAPNPDGDYDATNNTKPASMGLIVHDQNATPNDTHQNKRVTGVQGSVDNTRYAAHVAVLDEAGNPFSSSNPMPMEDVGSAGNPVQDFDQAVAVAAAGSANHDYSVASGQTLRLKQVIASGSSRCKFTLQIGDGAVSEVFATKAVWFQSEDQGDASMPFQEPFEVLGTVNTTTVRLIKENRDDDDAQDLYSTFLGSQA